jgi:hypothetical protein
MTDATKQADVDIDVIATALRLHCRAKNTFYPDYPDLVCAVFAALAARGLAVVPVDATEGMIQAGLYAAMVRAGRVGGSR